MFRQNMLALQVASVKIHKITLPVGLCLDYFGLCGNILIDFINELENEHPLSSSAYKPFSALSADLCF